VASLSDVGTTERWLGDNDIEGYHHGGPLFLVPIFLYVGYITGKASLKVWIGVTVAITLALSILYALL